MGEINERGNKITRGFCDGDRYQFDFNQCTAERGWIQYDTDQDAWYFGVWIHPETRRIMTYAEGDWSLVECLTKESYHAELKSMAEFYGDPPPALKVLNYEDKTITEYYDVRPE